MCAEQTLKEGNGYGGLERRWPKSFIQVSIWSNKVHIILFKNIWGETKETRGKGTGLYRYGFEILRTRGGEVLNDKTIKKVTIWITRRVDRDVLHACRRSYVTDKVRIQSGVLRGR